MKHSKRYFQLSSLALLALVLVSTGCQKLKARDELNKGVAAFKGGQYPVAVEHFKESHSVPLGAWYFEATATTPALLIASRNFELTLVDHVSVYSVSSRMSFTLSWSCLKFDVTRQKLSAAPLASVVQTVHILSAVSH